jgi:hypothetical protein
MARTRPVISDRRRVALGTLLLVMPLLFLVAVSLRSGLDAPALFDSFQVELLNRGHAILRPLTTGLIALGPPVAFLVNLPAVLRPPRRPTPPVNAAVVAVGFLVTLVFVSYGVAR